MEVHFLVEDVSGAKFLEAFLQKYIAEKPEVTFNYTIRPYKGIGGLKKGADAGNIKSQQLLTDLPKRLRALNVALSGNPDSSVFIVLDNDTRNPEAFRAQLEGLLSANQITVDSVFCIAVEEMEAWLLGDIEAMQQAYPKLADRIASKISSYQQDSICGTWEFLADILTKGGIAKFRKMTPSPQDVGMKTSEWAENIGCHMNIRNNCSPSFRYMIDALDRRRNTISSQLVGSGEK